MNQAVEDWLNEWFTSENTKKTYRKAINDFLNFAETPRSSEDLVKQLRRWIVHLKDEKFTPKTINLRVNAVRSFYLDRGIEIDRQTFKKIRNRILPKGNAVTTDRAGSHEEWTSILENMNQKARSLFLFLLSSSCRISEALQVKVSDLDLESDPPRANIRAKYTKGEKAGRTVFMTYEARDAIKKWLDLKKDLRKRTPKTVTLPDGRKIAPRPEDEKLVWDMSDSVVRETLRRAMRRAGITKRDEETGRYEIHVHSTRKFFRSNCGLSDALTHSLMGHNGYLDSSYLRTDIKKAEEEYKTAIPKLTLIDKSVDEVELTLNTLRFQGLSNDKLDQIRDVLNASTRSVEEKQQEVQEIVKDHFKQMMGVPESKGNDKEFKQIDQTELINYLNDGWEIYQQLNNGSNQVIISKVKP